MRLLEGLHFLDLPGWLSEKHLGQPVCGPLFTGCVSFLVLPSFLFFSGLDFSLFGIFANVFVSFGGFSTVHQPNSKLKPKLNSQETQALESHPKLSFNHP